MKLCVSEEQVRTILHIGQKLLDGVPFCELYINGLLDNSNILVFWKDGNGSYLACNKRFAEIGGVILPQNIVGKNDAELAWRKEQAIKYREDDRSVVGLLCPKLNIIEPILQADGKETMNLTSKFPIHSSNKKKFGLLGISSYLAHYKS
jgi:PAS domain-containing protein